MIFLTPAKSGGLKSTGTTIQQIYRLARILGYGYLSNRSISLAHTSKVTDEADLLRYVGFHEGENDIADPMFAGYRRLPVSLADLLNGETRDVLEIKRTIETVVVTDQTRPSILLVDPFGDHDLRNYLLQLMETHCRLACNRFDYDFRKKFWSVRGTDPHYLERSTSQAIPVCIHIRRGDVAAVRLGDKVLRTIPHEPGRGQILSASQFDRGDFYDCGFPFIEVDRFQPILDRLTALHGIHSLAISIFSDGYDSRYFEWVRPHLAGLGFADFDAFCRFLKEYEAREFSRFGHGTLHLGEGPEETKAAIRAFVTSTIVLKGTGGFARFFVEHIRSVPPELFIDLRNDQCEVITRKLEAYEAQRGKAAPGAFGITSFLRRVSRGIRRAAS